MKQKSLIIAFIVSVSLHLVLLGTLWIYDNFKVPATVIAPKKEVVHIEILDTEKRKDPNLFKEPKEDRRLIVEQNEEALNNEVPEDSRFLSRNNQKVLQETVALHRGKFQNDGGMGKGLSQKPKEEPRPKHTPKPQRPNLASLVPGYKFEPKVPKQEQTQEQQTPKPQVAEATEAFGDGHTQSQTRDHVEDVKKGRQTLLSSREFVYYSYYQRIREQLAQHWESKIREKIKNIYRTGRSIASEKNQVTKVMIVLNNQGVLIGVKVLAGSGLHDLDDAAIEAFRLAAPFPNPPEGIEEADGTIKIRWDFILEA